jgi:photosystem II stability/assembly factor-like uncharacterized protein
MFRTKTTIFLLLLSIAVCAQPWIPVGVNVQDLTYDQKVEYFEAYWKDKPVKKGKGYKQFKRWAYVERERLLENGKSQSPLHTFHEMQSFDRKYPASSDRNNIKWESLGPTMPDGGNSGVGRVNCMGFHPTDPNTYWVGTPIGGLWKTTDDGRTWSSATDQLPNLGVSDIIIHPQNPDIIYIATGDADGGARDNASIGVLKSTNGGQSWTQVQPVFQQSQGFNIYRMIMNPSDPNHMVLATSDGIYQSKDGLNSVKKVQTGWFCDVEFHPANPNVLYAATFAQYSSDFLSRLFISQNGGESWAVYFSFNQSPSEFSVDRVNIAVTKARPNGFYTLASHASSGFHSLTYFEGTNFDLILSGNSINLLNWDDDGNPEDPTGQGWYDLSYIVNHTNPNEMFVGGVNTWKVTGGTPRISNFWSAHPSQNTKNTPVVHADKHNFYYHPLKPGRLYECNDGGLYYTDNGGTSWVDISTGLVISQIYKLSVSTQRAADVMTGLQDNGSKNLQNGIWRDVSGGDGMVCIIDPVNPNIKYASLYNAQVIYRTTDNWQNNYVNIMDNHPEKGKGDWITPYMLHPQVSSTVFVAMSRVWRSDNRGESWQPISPVLTDRTITSLEVSPADPNIIYASTYTTLFRTLNGGNSWNEVYSAPGGSPIRNIKADPTNPNIVYLTMGGYVASRHVMVSNNRGSTFQSITFNLPNVPALDIEIHKVTGIMYVGTDLGVFFKGKDDQEWQRYGSQLPNTMVRDVEIAYNEGYIYAATYGRGLWRAPVSQSTAHNFIIAPTNLIFEAAPAACLDVSIICGNNDKWTLLYQNLDPSFDIVESITPRSGTGPATVKVCSNVNRLPIDIFGTLLIFPEGVEQPINVNVIQKASEIPQLRVYREPNLYTQDSSFIVPYPGGNIPAYILTNSVFDPATNLIIADADKQWLTVKSSNATAFAPFRQVVFEAKQNNGILNRYARVKLVFNNGQDSTFIFINQPSRTAEYLNVGPTEITLFPFEYTVNENISIQIRTDLSWTAEVTGHDGLNINAQSGKGDRKLILTLKKNDTSSTISGNIIVKALKADGTELRRTVKVNQLSFRSVDKDDSQTNLFPNPTTGTLQLSRDGGLEYNAIQIYDQNGRLVYSEPSAGNAVINDHKTLDLSYLTSGNYLMRIINNDNTETKSFIIIK